MVKDVGNRLRLRWCKVLRCMAVAVLVGAGTNEVQAQGVEAPAESGFLDTAKAAAPTESHPAHTAADSPEVAHTRAWHDTTTRFERWLSTQRLYDAAHTRSLRQRFAVAAARTTSSDASAFIDNMNARLDALTGIAGQEVEAYLADTLVVASPAYAAKVRAQVPDALRVTPGELDRRLSALAAQRRTSARLQQSFDEHRQAQIASINDQRRARQENAERARSRASAAVGSNSATNEFTPAREYFPDYGDQTTYILPFAGCWGWWGGGVILGPHR